MHTRGLEPPRGIAPPAPQADASTIPPRMLTRTNTIITAFFIQVNYIFCDFKSVSHQE